MFKIRTKFFIAFSVMFVLIAALSIIADYSLDQVYLGVDVINEEYSELDSLYELQALLHRTVTIAKNYLITRDPDGYQKYQASHELFKKKIIRFERISEEIQEELDEQDHEEKESELIENIKREYSSMEKTSSKIFSLSSPDSNASGPVLSNDLSKSFEIINQNIQRFRTEDQEELKKAINSARDAENKANNILWMSSLLALGLGLAFSIFFTRSITRPILDLCRGVDLISQGNYDAQVDINSSDEIGRLAEGYNLMGKKLKESYTLLENKVRERTAELEESNKNLQNLFNGITDGIYVIDNNYKIVNINKAAANLFELLPQDIIGKNCYHLFDGKQSLCEACPVKETFRTGHTTSAMKEWEKPGGEKFYADVNAFPLSGKQGVVTHVIEHIRDITEKKHMEERLVQSEKLAAIGEFAAGVAHEINNPLTTVAGCAEGLLSRMKEESFPLNEDLKDFPEYLKTIEEEAYHCKAITSSLLDFSRQLTPTFKEAEINQLITHTLDSFKKQKGLGDVQVVLDLSPRPLFIHADDAQLRQVFYNVIKNGVDAAKTEGRILIKTVAGNHEIQVVFEDNGQGIPSDQLSKVFNPFFTTKPPGQGTGLGLSLCYGIIEQHGGSIQIDSKGTGKGTTITIVLPFHRAGDVLT